MTAAQYLAIHPNASTWDLAKVGLACDLCGAMWTHTHANPYAGLGEPPIPERYTWKPQYREPVPVEVAP